MRLNMATHLPLRPSNKNMPEGWPTAELRLAIYFSEQSADRRVS